MGRHLLAELLCGDGVLEVEVFDGVDGFHIDIDVAGGVVIRHDAVDPFSVVDGVALARHSLVRVHRHQAVSRVVHVEPTLVKT